MGLFIKMHKIIKWWSGISSVSPSTGNKQTAFNCVVCFKCLLLIVKIFLTYFFLKLKFICLHTCTLNLFCCMSYEPLLRLLCNIFYYLYFKCATYTRSIKEIICQYIKFLQKATFLILSVSQHIHYFVKLKLFLYTSSNNAMSFHHSVTINKFSFIKFPLSEYFSLKIFPSDYASKLYLHNIIQNTLVLHDQR